MGQRDRTDARASTRVGDPSYGGPDDVDPYDADPYGDGSAGETYDVRRRRSHRATIADPDSLPPRLRRRRAYALLGMTLLLPGSAQFVAGNRRLGRVGLRLWFTALGLVIAAALIGLLRRSWLLGLAARSSVLLVVAALLALLALLWAALFLDAARLARLRRLPARTRRGVVLLTVLGIALTAGPLSWAASSVYRGATLVSAVFGADVSRPPAQGRYNILLMGGDSGADRVGTRPDTLILASMSAQTGKVVTFGFARDTENINFRPGSVMARLMPEGWNCGDNCLLNGLYTWATEHKKDFPADVVDPGAHATVEAVEALSGLDIQYYVLIDLQGFQQAVDAVGGLDVVVKTRTPVGGGSSPIYEYIEPGTRHLNGFYALWYARSREGSTNYERMARQRCVLAAAMKQLDPRTVILRFGDLAAAGEKVLHSDIPQGDLGGLADLALKSRSTPMKSVNFVPPLMNPWDYDPRVITDGVRAAIAASESGASASPAASAAPGPDASGSPASPNGASPSDRAGGGPQDVSRGAPSALSLTGDGSDICTVP